MTAASTTAGSIASGASRRTHHSRGRKRSHSHLPDFSGGFRRVSPSRARRCAVCTRRSRTASAIVGRARWRFEVAGSTFPLARRLNLPSHIDRVARIGDVWRICLRQLATTVQFFVKIQNNVATPHLRSLQPGFQRQLQKARTAPFDIHAASFAALTRRALTMLRAGLALNIIGSPLKSVVAAIPGEISLLTHRACDCRAAVDHIKFTRRAAHVDNSTADVKLFSRAACRRRLRAVLPMNKCPRRPTPLRTVVAVVASVALPASSLVFFCPWPLMLSSKQGSPRKMSAIS